MKEILNRLINYERLSTEEAREILINISAGKYNANQIASFLTIYLMRGVSVAELSGFRNALLELCLTIDLSEFETIDLCGTGGDGKDTFNISTLSAFVTAGADVKVTKHGNYSVSSACGSSNVLEAVGVHFTNEESKLKQMLDKAGIAFLHAPLFHPAMKTVAPIRKELGVKTFFNMLGPLVNPAAPKAQLTGVFNMEVMRLYHYLFQQTETNFAIVYALDGYDEISLTGTTRIITKQEETLMNPKDLGVEMLKQEEIYGGDSVESSAKIFLDILDGNGTEAQNNVVCANAGLAIATAKEISHQDGFQLAQESLRSGKAKQSLNTLIQLSA